MTDEELTKIEELGKKVADYWETEKQKKLQAKGVK